MAEGAEGAPKQPRYDKTPIAQKTTNIFVVITTFLTHILFPEWSTRQLKLQITLHYSSYHLKCNKNGPLSKPSKSEFWEGDTEHRSGAYLDVREHSSTGSTYPK
ncbi:MAG: palindromic element RPE1 domain-containing protein, partial [Holosporales bacterium]|nr:palindromic element RPE1 domain-containing protein [Holosporales bacterium]